MILIYIIFVLFFTDPSDSKAKLSTFGKIKRALSFKKARPGTANAQSQSQTPTQLPSLESYPDVEGEGNTSEPKIKTTKVILFFHHL